MLFRSEAESGQDGLKVELRCHGLEEGGATLVVVLRGWGGEGGFGQGGRLGEAQAADQVLDPGEGGGRDTQFLDAEAEQQRDEQWVSGSLPADAHVPLGSASGGRGGMDQLQNGGVGWRIKAGDPLIHPIDGEGVTGQVVCSDAEELDVGGEVACDQGGGWNLDHHADLDRVVEGEAGLTKVLFALVGEPDGLDDLLHGADHGQKDAHGAVGACTQQRPQLGAEQVGPVQADADGPPAKERVGFMVLGPCEELVAAEIKGADHGAMGCAGFGDGPVGLVLGFLVRGVFGVEEEVFGSEEADALCAGLADGVEVARFLDVGAERDASSDRKSTRLNSSH